MAGLKKPSRRRDNSNPNLVLIIFLVFFVLVSIGLGVWGYYGYAGQEKLINDAKTASNQVKGAKQGEDYHRMIAYEVMLMIGQPLDADQMTELNGLRDEFKKEGGKFDKEKTRELVKKTVDEAKKGLGFKDAEGKYDKTYPEEFVRLGKIVAEKEGDVTRLQTEVKTTQEKLRELQAQQDKANKGINDVIEAGNKATLSASRQKADEFRKAVEQNDILTKQLAEAGQDSEKMKLELERKIRELNAKLQEIEGKRIELAAPTRNPTEPHALMLDISRGKPLWDRPVGKIIRVDMAQRQVAVNLGSSSGVKPEQTFSVFGVGPYGSAEKHLKGSIEITRVLDAQTALARITSLYEANGEEIRLNDQGLLRLQRESESALREGDLLFNMFWGNHVAIAGPATLSPIPSDNPAEQMRQLAEFGAFLERQGMPVDAYIDLAAGDTKGKITNSTRFLILAKDLVADAKDPSAERVKNINEFKESMRKEAIEKGCFLISLENFLTLVGYHAPRSAGDVNKYIGFRPSQPAAGIALPGIPGITGGRPRAEVNAAPADAAPAAEEKKAADKDKDKEEKN